MDPLAMLAGVVQDGGVEGESPVPRPGWLPEWFPPWGVELVASILVVVLAWVAARLAVRLFGRRIAQYIERPSLTRVTLGGIRIGVYVFALLVLLRINGLDLGSIALSVTVFSAVVGVILAPIVGSIISGIFLLADQPYEIGDMIELTEQGRRGFVEDITLRYTKIFTLDNTFLVVPNGEMRNRDVINYSAEDTRTRLALDVLVTYESDIALARELLEKGARSVDGVISGGPRIRVGGARYPAAPQALIWEFGDSGILLRLRYWATDPYHIQTVKSAVNTNIWTALEDEPDVEVAYPHLQHVFDENSGELRLGSGAVDPETQPPLDPAETGEAVGDGTGEEGTDPGSRRE
ncbi:MAG: mechanosensitive ion channel family protein [Halovenus sp.]